VQTASDEFTDKLALNHHMVYGSSRLGVVNENLPLYTIEFLATIGAEQQFEGVDYTGYTIDIHATVDYEVSTLVRGKKRYELSNHLGNVMAVIQDRKRAKLNIIGSTTTTAFYMPYIVETHDYYAYGSLMEGRGFSTESYRFAFNGMEQDNEVAGQGNAYDFGARMYDSRLGRWMSVDPLQAKYAGLTPYNFVSNQPIIAIDPDGKEKIIVVGSENRTWNLGFVLPALRRMKQLKDGGTTEDVSILLFTSGYTAKQRSRISKYAAKKGASVIEVNSANDVTSYINNKSTNNECAGRGEDPISEFTIFAHGQNQAVMFGYDQGKEIREAGDFTGTHASRMDAQAFMKSAFCLSYACRTGAGNGGNGNVEPEKSLAQRIANNADITVMALQRRSDYENILPDDRDIIDKGLEYIGLKDGDHTYDSDAGSWDTDAAINKVKEPIQGTSPDASPGWTIYSKGESPKVKPNVR
jgi:RHS repeat-associated protein